MPRQISMVLVAAQPEQNADNHKKPLLLITPHLYGGPDSRTTTLRAYPPSDFEERRRSQHHYLRDMASDTEPLPHCPVSEVGGYRVHVCCAINPIRTGCKPLCNKHRNSYRSCLDSRTLARRWSLMLSGLPHVQCSVDVEPTPAMLRSLPVEPALLQGRVHFPARQCHRLKHALEPGRRLLIGSPTAP